MSIKVYALTAAQAQRVTRLEVQVGKAVEVLSTEANFIHAAMALAKDKEAKVYAVCPAANEAPEERVLVMLLKPPYGVVDTIYAEYLQLDDVKRDSVNKNVGALLQAVMGKAPGLLAFAQRVWFRVRTGR